MLHEKLLVNTVHVDDVDEQAKMLIDWEQEYQQLGHGKFAGTVSGAAIGEFTLIRETTNMALHERIMPPEEKIVIGMCFARENSPSFNGRLFDQNSLLIIDSQRSHDMRTEGYLEMLAIAVDRDYFFYRLHEHDVCMTIDAINATVMQLTPRAADMLRQYFVIVSDMLQNRAQHLSPTLTPRMLANSALSNIPLAISLSTPEQYRDTLPKQHRRDRIVQCAIEYMRKNSCEEIGILDVCAATHVSRRTLQYCFEERLNISPLQYLKALRLNQARRQLRHLMEVQAMHANQNTIANIAALCGFNHASRFASDYKRMFGELPSQIKV